MPVYNKLVRDRIPKIMEAQGKRLKVRTLVEDEYVRELKNKSKEELDEYLNTDNDGDATEELADLLEVIHALARVHGTDMAGIEKIRMKKAAERGGFNERFFLIEAEGE
ncbi:phosphoribosyl-ATP pyrophosphohydrolase [Bacillus sp. 1P06AnD]|uniref:phosphoribosyl-ATP pyrophosphohydrolase n=1 Tax=Bacillus sp. 1P06AnD TaxID=3132208 RepID=UPI0039A1963C